MDAFPTISKKKGKKMRKKRSVLAEDGVGEAADTGVVKAEDRKRKLNTFGTTSKRQRSDDLFAVASDKEATVGVNERHGAFAISEIDTSHDQDARALLEKKIKLTEEAKADGDKKVSGTALVVL